jgi:hypothetical protein
MDSRSQRWPRRRRRRHPARRPRRAVGISATAASVALVGAMAVNAGAATADDTAAALGGTEELTAPVAPDQQVAPDGGWEDNRWDEHRWDDGSGPAIQQFPPATADQGSAASPPMTSSHGS